MVEKHRLAKIAVITGLTNAISATVMLSSIVPEEDFMKAFAVTAIGFPLFANVAIRFVDAASHPVRTCDRLKTRGYNVCLSVCGCARNGLQFLGKRGDEDSTRFVLLEDDVDAERNTNNPSSYAGMKTGVDSPCRVAAPSSVEV